MSHHHNNPTWKYDFQLNNPDTWLPTFGEWCGKGWSDGERSDRAELFDPQEKGTVTRINDRDSPMDTWCRDHDLNINATYMSSRSQAKTLKADLILYARTSPSNGHDLTASEAVYATLTNSAFRLKILFLDVPNAIREAVAIAAKNAYRSVFNGAHASKTSDAPTGPVLVNVAPSWRLRAAGRSWGLHEQRNPPAASFANTDAARGRFSGTPLRNTLSSGAVAHSVEPSAPRCQLVRHTAGESDADFWSAHPCISGLHANKPNGLANHASVRSLSTLIANTHSLVQSLAGFRPQLAAQIRLPGACEPDHRQLDNRPAWLTKPL